MASRGFVLLHALWLLLTASVLIAGITAFASNRSADVFIEERIAQLEYAQESALEMVIYSLVTQKARSKWFQPPSAKGTLDVDDLAVQVTVQNVEGLVDFLTSDDVSLRGALRDAQTPNEADLFNRLAVVRKAFAMTASDVPSTYWEMQLVTALPNAEFDCLYRRMTLYSGKAHVDPKFALPSLSSTLRLKLSSETPSAMEESQGVAGQTYRIEATTSTADVRSQVLTAEVAITGSLRPSHLIRDQHYMARAHVGAAAQLAASGNNLRSC